MGANALLGRGHQEERLKPDVQLDMAGLHNALGGDAEVLAARLDAATIDARLLGRERLVDYATVRANALGTPTQGFQILSGGFDGLEMRGVEMGLGHGDHPI